MQRDSSRKRCKAWTDRLLRVQLFTSVTQRKLEHCFSTKSGIWKDTLRCHTWNSFFFLLRGGGGGGGTEFYLGVPKALTILTDRKRGAGRSFSFSSSRRSFLPSIMFQHLEPQACMRGQSTEEGNERTLEARHLKETHYHSHLVSDYSSTT